MWSGRGHIGLSLIAPKLERWGQKRGLLSSFTKPGYVGSTVPRTTFDLLDCHWRWESGFLHV